MTNEDALARLSAYESECRTILGRFVRSRDSIHIDRNDAGRLASMVIELRDFFDDLLGKNTYSTMVVNAYNEGISNFLRSPSYSSVERIIGIISAVLTRIRSNPSLLVREQVSAVTAQTPEQSPLAVPQTVTLYWLFKHVPYSLWAILGGLLLTAFLLGITATKLSIVREWFSLPIH